MRCWFPDESEADLSKSDTKYVSLPVNSKSEANEGYELNGKWHWVRLCSVDSDGTVRVFDEVADHYTTIHSLSDDQVKKARELAALK